jgi:hypothetical protein
MIPAKSARLRSSRINLVLKRIRFSGLMYHRRKPGWFCFNVCFKPGNYSKTPRLAGTKPGVQELSSELPRVKMISLFIK